ncbi:MAG: alpha-amylase/4-alpha-glucanotransferase domain-containing protein, partial [Gemmatimonadales bacterium]
DAGVADPDDIFTTELSLAGPLDVRSTPRSEEWRFDIETVAKSERGLDRTRQGESITLRWPVQRRQTAVEIRPAG